MHTTSRLRCSSGNIGTLFSVKKLNRLTNQQLSGEIKSINKTVLDQVNVHLRHFA